MSTAVPRGSIVARIATLVVAHPWRMLIAGLVLFFAVTPGLGRVYQNIRYDIWFQDGDPAIERLHAFEQRFGSDVAAQLVVHSPSGIFDVESAKLIVELTDRVWKSAEIIRVQSLSNFSWIHPDGDDIIVEPLIPDDEEPTEELLAERREVALEHEQLPGFLISRDGKTTVIYAWLEPESTSEPNDFVTNTKELKELAAEFGKRGDHAIYVAGFPAMEAYVETEPPKEMQELTPVILGVSMLFLLVFFRRATAMLLPFLVVLPSVLTTLAIAGWAGFGIDPMTITAPNLLVVIAISSSVHVLFAYYRALDRGVARKEAAQGALERTLLPTFFACLTTGVGFLSLVTMAYPPMQHLGVLVAAGTMVVWLLTCLVLGPLMVLLPIKPRTGKKAKPDGDLDAATPRAERITAVMDRYKVPIVAGWVVLTGVSVWLALQNRVTFDPIDWYDERTDIRVAQDFFREQMGPSEGFEIIVESGKEDGIKDPEFLRKVDELGAWIKGHDKVIQVTSLVDILKETNRALFGGADSEYRLPDTQRGIADQYLLYTLNLPLGQSLNDRVTMSNDALRMTVLSQLRESPAVLDMADRIRAKAAELGLKVELTGRPLLYHQLNPHVVPSFTRSIIAATVVIAILLLLFFRSPRLGALSLLMNVVPLVVGAGVVFYLLDRNFDMAAVSGFGIALGVAVDDTVHFLSAYSHLRRQGLDTRESISRLWSTVGPAMVITTVILTSCFGLFLLNTFVISRLLGALVGSMLIIALLADVVLMPALLLLFAKKKPAAKS